MTAVIQRVFSASVRVDGELVGRCGKGLCILLGVAKGDTEQDADALMIKIAGLRIFNDENGKMNRSIRDVRGSMLIVPNFTLLASYKKGYRPDYMSAEAPERAERLYNYFCGRMELLESLPISTGVFGADMELQINNDGPVTIVMESSVLLGKK